MAPNSLISGYRTLLIALCPALAPVPVLRSLSYWLGGVIVLYFGHCKPLQLRINRLR